MGRKHKKNDCAETDAVADALSQLPPPSQEPLAPPTYRIKEMTKEINSSVICKLTRIYRLPLLVEEIKKEVKEIVEMADKKGVLKCTRNVLHCTNSGCKANFWNRDVNAARNMLELLKSGLKGKHGARRLRAFRR
ncbi:hypothetical protein BBJ29_010170, partial [Phytophthora kernoviae]